MGDMYAVSEAQRTSWASKPEPLTPVSGTGYRGLADQERARLAEESRAKEAFEQALKAVHQAEQARTLAELYVKQGEILRQAWTLQRQGQYCTRCGYQFNYDLSGEPRKDWCRPQKLSCTNEDNKACWDQQERERKAHQRGARQLSPDKTPF